jgi:hypothetical protein
VAIAGEVVSGKRFVCGGAEKERCFSSGFTPGEFLVGKEKNLELLPVRNPNLFFACF